MSDAIKRARKIITKARGYSSLEVADIADAALDCLEVLRRPEWRCSGCGLEVNDRSRMLGYHAKQTWKGQALCDGDPVDLHAAAWEKFEEAINE